MNIKVMLKDGAYMPVRAHAWDAGFDLRTRIQFTLFPDDQSVIDTGVHMLIPKGYVGMIKSKSGLNVRYGIRCEGVIDAGYTGSILVSLINRGRRPVTFLSGEKIAQIVILPLPDVQMEESEELEETERGANGFGSSGRF